MTPAAPDASAAAGMGRDGRRLPGALAADTEANAGRGASELLCGLRGGTCRRRGLPVIGSRLAGRWSPKWATPGSALWLCGLTLTFPTVPLPPPRASRSFDSTGNQTEVAECLTEMETILRNSDQPLLGWDTLGVQNQALNLHSMQLSRTGEGEPVNIFCLC